ncbi:hypothetical protein FRC17_004657 [Serendipita sp. 399]|nr:hypothetical protein FRC17_004657 [Serendipita sp. 399]
MASRTPPPARPIPPAPAENGSTVNEVAVKKAQNAAVADIVAENEKKGVTTYNLSPDTKPEDLKTLQAKAKASLGLPQVVGQNAEKGAQADKQHTCLDFDENAQHA